MKSFENPFFLRVRVFYSVSCFGVRAFTQFRVECKINSFEVPLQTSAKYIEISWDNFISVPYEQVEINIKKLYTRIVYNL